MEDAPNRDLIERAEDLILRLREVRSARIYADEEGRIAEIHVVAATDRAPKLIARDVETAIKAGLGVSVDYRKIGVVIMEPRKASAPAEAESAPVAPAAPGASAAPAGQTGPAASGGSPGPAAPAENADDKPVDLRELLAEPLGTPGPGEGASEFPGLALEFLEEDARVRFKSIRVTIEGERVEVEVKLEKNGLVVTGVGSDVRRGGNSAAAAASATVEAIGELIDEQVHLHLDGAAETEVAGRPALCIVVSAVRGREAARFAGCALAGDDRSESAVLAVLDALNRPLGRWKLRREIRYRIS